LVNRGRKTTTKRKGGGKREKTGGQTLFHRDFVEKRRLGSKQTTQDREGSDNFSSKGGKNRRSARRKGAGGWELIPHLSSQRESGLLPLLPESKGGGGGPHGDTEKKVIFPLF